MGNWLNILFLLLLAFVSCSNKSNIKTSEVPADTLKVFTFPPIPPALNTPEVRTDYLIKRYWDCINLADTNYIHHPEITEQAWVDFIDLFKLVPPATSANALKTLFKTAEKEKKVFLYLAELADKYLYDPNSPLRNEEHYIPVLDVLIASPILTEAEKIRPQKRRALAQRNRIGTKATDFAYTLASGKKGTLHAIASTYTVLFFNNPGCKACEEGIEALQNLPAIRQAVSQKQLQILAIYPDEELDEWKKHLSDLPPHWINGYDHKRILQKKQLYDLKAIPTFYLLDKNKSVLLKDANAADIDQYLRH